MVKISVDPITLEVVQNALSSIADELALVIMRAAYSNIVRDSMDYSTAVCDFSGKTIAQGLTNPVHLGSFPHAMKNLVFQQKANMNEGDIFIFNDPYGSGGMHLPDFYIIKPIFINNSIEGYTATLAHQGITRAFAKSEATYVLIFDYLRLPFTALFAFYIFLETPTISIFLGSLIIFISSIYIINREKVAGKKETTPVITAKRL